MVQVKSPVRHFQVSFFVSHRPERFQTACFWKTISRIETITLRSVLHMYTQPWRAIYIHDVYVYLNRNSLYKPIAKLPHGRISSAGPNTKCSHWSQLNRNETIQSPKDLSSANDTHCKLAEEALTMHLYTHSRAFWLTLCSRIYNVNSTYSTGMSQ